VRGEYVFMGREGIRVLPAQCGADAVEAPAVAAGVVPLQVHPNPFSDRTNVVFYVPVHASSVRLTVFDVGGRRVRTLVHGETERAGSRTARWDGRDNAGRAVPVGVYFVRLDVDGRKSKTKVVRIR
jgi:flagellar hook assembly protein FlgD